MSFNDEWEKVILGLYIKEIKKYTSDFEKYPLFTFSVEGGVTPKTDRYERGFLVKKEGETFKVIEENQFLINPMNLRFGAVNFSKIKEPVSVSGYYDIFEIENKKNCNFWYGLLSNNKSIKLYNTIATGSLSEKKRVHFSQLKELKFFVPKENERSKISLILQKIVERIETQSKIINKLESLKIQIKERIFNLGTIKKTISDVLIENNKKANIQGQYPVLSSTVKGLFLQSDYFEREVASSNNIGYKIVKKGQIIISPQNLWMGNITFNDTFENGIVSPSYKVFDIKNKYFKNYIYWLLTSKHSFFNYSLVSEQGASIVRRNLNYDSFLNLTLPLCNEEQQKHISKLIDSIETKLKLEERKLQLFVNQKNYLLSNLFI